MPHAKALGAASCELDSALAALVTCIARMWSNLQSSFTAKINMSCYRISTLLCLTALLALWPPVTEAQLQLTNFNMTRAVEILAERFRQVATDGLGIDALKVSLVDVL